jgi:hypothetical protein
LFITDPSCHTFGSDGKHVRHSKFATNALADVAVDNFIDVRGKTALITLHYASILPAFGLSQ